MQILKNPFISIVTPVYNREDCIGKCIENVKSQLYKDYEHIIVDDGSTDKTRQSVQHYYMNKDVRLRLIMYKNNRGVNYARNRGIEAVTGKYILFLDSDDYLLPNSLEIIMHYISDYPNYKHYMFMQTDRVALLRNNPILSEKVNEVKYEDWLCERISGDFVHVIHIDVLKKYPFFEEFRLYEGLNFLRFYKDTQKQLIIKETIVGRERKRKDSLTNEGFLFKKNAIENEFKVNKLFKEYFGNDLKNICNENYRSFIKRTIILGIAACDYISTKHYLNELNENEPKLNLYRALILLKMGLPTKFAIKSLSLIKNTLLTNK